MEQETVLSKLSWKLMLIPVIMFIPSTFQLFVPDLYAGLYTEAVAGISIKQLMEDRPAIYQVVILGFQGIGLAAIMCVISLFAITLIPFRKHEKWAWFTCLAVSAIGWGGNLVLEMRGHETAMVIYSIAGLVFAFLALTFSLKRVFS